MTENQLLAILVQLPIVAIFLWYNERKDRFIGKLNEENQAFLREERAARIAQFERLETKLANVHEDINDHRQEFKVAVARMEATTARNHAAATAERKTTPRGAAKQ